MPFINRDSPAAFGRLSVETSSTDKLSFVSNPAAFGRLSVETKSFPFFKSSNAPSRLRAAEC